MSAQKSELVIGGEHRLSSDGSTFEVRNPATRQLLGNVPKATFDDTKAAIEFAQDAFESWSDTPAPSRAEILYKVGEMIRARQGELSELLTLEEGKALNESLAEIIEGYDTVMYIAAEGRRMWSNVSPSELKDKFCMVVRRPVGIVGIITPWNFPFAIPLWKIPAALVAGNTVVFKPASATPLIAQQIVSMFEAAGLPKGVLNFVTGPGSGVGETIVNDSRIKVVSFTGESVTGHHIAELNSRFFRRQVLELGGKNPVIVSDDADLSTAIPSILYAAFSNCGQKCTAASRIIVDKKIHKSFLEKFVRGSNALRVGNGMEEGMEVGPLISDRALQKVESYVEVGVSEGAVVVAGGKRYEDDKRSRGYFFQPTVFDSATNDMRISQEEIFGPVVSIIEADDTAAAIKIANDTKYGLSSAVYTKDLKKAFQTIAKLESGIGYVNQGPTGAEVHLPFGGLKETGNSRESGETAIENYTEKKSIYIDYSYQRRPWFFGQPD
jgi:alpha-ketoglutaric semialdehyde dehydrogenase